MNEKRAVVFVGAPRAGKGRVIREFLLPRLGKKADKGKFTLHKRKGAVLWQTYEAEGRDNAFMEIQLRYLAETNQLLVLPARPPEGDAGVSLQRMIDILRARGYAVQRLDVSPEGSDAYCAALAAVALEFMGVPMGEVAPSTKEPKPAKTKKRPSPAPEETGAG